MTTLRMNNKMLKNGKFDQSIITSKTVNVILNGCSDLTTIDGIIFPGDVDASGCPNLNSVTGNTVNGSLKLGECPSLTTISDNIVKGHAVNACDCHELTSITNNTFNVYIVEIMGCKNLNLLTGNIFNGNFKGNYCEKLPSITDNQFQGGYTQKNPYDGPDETIQGYIEIKDCISITSLEGIKSISSLDISDCTGIKSVNVEDISEVEMSGCTAVTSVIAKYLDSLDMDGCVNVTFLELESVDSINLDGCTKLKPTRELIGALITAEEAFHINENARLEDTYESEEKIDVTQTIVWPDHFNREEEIIKYQAESSTHFRDKIQGGGQSSWQSFRDQVSGTKRSGREDEDENQNATRSSSRKRTKVTQTTSSNEWKGR